VPPHLEEHAQNLPRPKQSFELAMHITNTHWHNGQKLIGKMKRNHTIPLDHPSYSPDLSPCDFW
jgi:hypothetical protein